MSAADPEETPGESKDHRHWIHFTHDGQEFAVWQRDPSDFDTVQAAIRDSGTFYEIAELSFLRNLVQPGARIVDAGANIGNHAIFFDRVCGASEVIPFEPNPAVIEELRVNLERNGCRNVDLSHLGIALSSEPGRGTMFLSEDDRETNNRAGMMIKPAEEGEIQFARLDDLVQGKIDLLKIDVEGLSMEVLAGAQHLIADSRPVLWVEIEDEDEPALHRWLADAGYETRAVLSMYRGIHNYICLPGITNLPDVLEGEQEQAAEHQAEANSTAAIQKPLLDRLVDAWHGKSVPPPPPVSLPLADRIAKWRREEVRLAGEAIAPWRARLSEVLYAQNAFEALAMADLLPAIQALYGDRETPVAALEVGASWGGGSQLLARLHHRWSYARPIFSVEAAAPNPDRVVTAALFAPDVVWRVADPFALEDMCCDLLIANYLLQREADPLAALSRLRKAAREFVLVAVPLDEDPLPPGHFARFGRDFVDACAAAAYRIHRNSAWGHHGDTLTFALTNKALTERQAAKLKSCGFHVV